MSTTGRSLRIPGDTDDVLGTTRGHATLPPPSWVRRLAATDNLTAATVARLTLAVVLFPHAAQKLFGWFGGHGFSGTYGSFTQQLHIPGWLAATAIITEITSVILLILGAFTRVAAIGIISVMIGAIAVVHANIGFFMNWYGTQAGEGFEYHLLVIGLALVCMLLGGGTGSVDRAITLHDPRNGAGLIEPVTRD